MNEAETRAEQFVRTLLQPLTPTLAEIVKKLCGHPST